ncbi:MAG: type II CAAX endopeptidase family protein [Nitrososphaerales archaeon]
MNRREALARAKLFAIFFGLVLSFFIIRIIVSPADPIGFALLAGSSAAFLFLALFSRRNERLSKYWQVFFVFFIVSIVPLSWGILPVVIAEQFGLAPDAAVLNFLLLNWLLIVAPIIILTKVSGGDMGSIFLKRGNLKLGLILGIIGFVVAFVLAVPLANSFYAGENITFIGVLPLMPLIFVAIFANASLEEVSFRGVILKKLEPHLGRTASNIFQAIIFMLAHLLVGYARFPLVFIAFTFFIGLLFGYLMTKTDSIIAPILVHAGGDVAIFMVLLTNG